MPITFKEKPDDYANGRRVNAEEWNAISRTVESATLKFGIPVIAGSGRHTCVAVSAKNQDVLGITETSQILPHPDDNYVQYDTAAICESGVIGVIVSKAIAKGVQARWNPTTGKWTDASASATAITIPGAFFEEAGGADGVVVAVRYRRQQGQVTGDGT